MPTKSAIPLLGTARALVAGGATSRQRYDVIAQRFDGIGAEEVRLKRHRLTTAEAVIAPLASRADASIAVAAHALARAGELGRSRFFAGRLLEAAGAPLLSRSAINAPSPTQLGRPIRG